MPRKKIIKQLHQAPEGQLFQVKDGPILRNIADLRDALATMDDEQFEHHVKQDRNDFASWVLSVFKEWHLAEKLERRWTKKQAHDTVDRHLKAYYEGFGEGEGV